MTLLLVLSDLPLFSPFSSFYSSAVSFSFHLFGCNCPQVVHPHRCARALGEKSCSIHSGMLHPKICFPSLSLSFLPVFSHHPPGFYSICKGQNEPQDTQCTVMRCRQQDDVRSRNPKSNITLQIRRKIPKKQEKQHTKVPAIGSLWLYE